MGQVYWYAIPGALLAVWVLLSMKLSRPDGVYAKKIHPYRRIVAHVQPTKTESAVAFDVSVDAEPFIAYMEKADGKFPVDYTHAMVGAVGLALIKHPELNRFISGGRFYQRSENVLSFAVKREKMNKAAALAPVKLTLEDGETFAQLCHRIEGSITLERSGKKTYADKEFSLLNAIPRPALWVTIRFLKLLDYYNVLPGAFIKGDVLYTSAFLANLGSLGMAPAYHHLFEWGNCPIFLAMGAIEERAVVEDGEVVAKTVLPGRFVFDERVCDGLTAWRCIQSGLQAFEAPETHFGCLADDGSDHWPLGHEPSVDWSAHEPVGSPHRA